jgi:DNA (cytosine-5)-methyltransferase 1
MKFISFFTGIGGFDLGLEREGYECVAQIEIDKNCNKVLNYQYPKVKKFKDISIVNPKVLPQADLYVGGFPCQDLSIANKGRKGFEGKRSALWWEFIRCVEDRKPTYVLAENVKGLLSSRKGQDMGDLIKSLVDRGYSCEWRVLDSQYFGIPQRRKRLFLIATHIERHIGKGSYRPILFEQKELLWNIEKSKKAQVGDSSQARESTKKPNVKDVYIKVSRGGNITGDKWRNNEVHPTLNCFDIGDVRTIAAVITKDNEVRRLTPIECERLQGFPDNWTKYGINDKGEKVEIPESARYNQCGNAVTINVIQWIGKRLKLREREREAGNSYQENH